MILSDPSVVLVISETCLAEVQRLIPDYQNHPKIHYLSSGQSYSRKVVEFILAINYILFNVFSCVYLLIILSL